MKYQEFFSITIEHSYFSGGPADLIVYPEEKTRKLLEKQGFLLKRTGTGIKVLLPMRDNNRVFPVLTADDLFAFHVLPTSGTVREFTDISEIEEDNMILFTNEGLDIGTIELIKSETVKEEVFQNFPALAKIEIKGNQITTDVNGTPPVYKAIFDSKSIKWKYYLLSKSGATDIAVETRGDQLQFNELEIGNNSLDPIITSLRLNFPDTKIAVFESSVAIPFSSKSIKDIKLIQRDSVTQTDSILMKHLPNPSIYDQGIQIIKIK